MQQDACERSPAMHPKPARIDMSITYSKSKRRQASKYPYPDGHLQQKQELALLLLEDRHQPPVVFSLTCQMFSKENMLPEHHTYHKATQ